MPYINKITLQYPVSEREIFEIFPNVSFASPFVAPDPYALVFQTPQPTFDAIKQFVRESAPKLTVKGHYEQTWELVALSDERVTELTEQKRFDFIRRIDADADTIYAAALGNRATEYAQAEAEATAYKSAGYSGDVPGYVQAWATATFKSSQWAADDILATAQGWRNAQAAIRLNRLTCKEIARNATTFTELDSVEAQWAGFLSAIKIQLGIA